MALGEGLVARMEGTQQGPGAEVIIIIMFLVCLLLTEGKLLYNVVLVPAILKAATVLHRFASS